METCIVSIVCLRDNRQRKSREKEGLGIVISLNLILASENYRTHLHCKELFLYSTFAVKDNTANFIVHVHPVVVEAG